MNTIQNTKIELDSMKLSNQYPHKHAVSIRLSEQGSINPSATVDPSNDNMQYQHIIGFP